MSKFKTVIPVDVAAIVAMLPPNSFVEGVTFDKDAGAVCVTWDNDRLVTPYSFASDFPAANLREQRVPAGVTVAGKAVEPVAVVKDNAGASRTGKEPNESATVTDIADAGQQADAGDHPAEPATGPAKPGKRGKGRT